MDVSARNGAFDRFRGIGAVCVVLLHAPPFYRSSVEPLNIAGWSLRMFCQAAVPYFFLLSGWMLGSKWIAGRRGNQELARTARRLLSLYLPWFGFFLLLDAIGGQPTSPIAVLRRLVGFSDRNLDTRGYHLWFLPSLLLAQCLVWWSLRKTGNVKPAVFAGVALYVAMAVADAVGWNLPWGLAAHEGVDVSLVCVAMGALLALRPLAWSDRFLAGVVVLCVPATLLEGVLWDAARRTSWTVHSFGMLRVLLPLLLLAWLVRKPKFVGGGGIGKLLDFLGTNATGIYVIHLAFLVLVPYAALVPSGFVRENLVRWSTALLGASVLSDLMRRAPWAWCRNLVA